MTRQVRTRAPGKARSPKALADSRLTRARILTAGLDLLAREGVAGLSMRTLAEALGTAPMSLYRHVHSKDELLSAIVAGVLEQLDLDLRTRGAWTDQAAAWMHSLRNQLHRSPAVVSILMQHGHYTPAMLRATNTLLGILRAAGFDRRAAVRAWREIMWSTLAFVSSEIRGPAFSPSFYMQAIDESQRVSAKALRADEVAEVVAHMPHLRTRDLDDVFAHIVKHLLAGLAAELAETASHREGARNTHARMAAGAR
ncbi:MAG: helix-turn-helix transcriptional regulator [Deltaproteobacteria bacterium]|nr:helix-turn-helix transcriptional regulator [Deltaproteobacteria bacterium]MBI3390262.1 helix-turn-helix transcriptional regulator [Deltaproteobacteria bacterium]